MKKKKAEPKVYLTDNQISELKSDVKGIEELLKRRENPQDHVGRKIQYPSDLRAELEQKRKLIANHTPKKLTGRRANEAYAEAKKLKEQIEKKLLPSSAMYARYPKDGVSKADFERAVVHETKLMQDRQHQENIARYKEIMRRIDPSDPTVTNIERLRR